MNAPYTAIILASFALVLVLPPSAPATISECRGDAFPPTTNPANGAS